MADPPKPTVPPSTAAAFPDPVIGRIGPTLVVTGVRWNALADGRPYRVRWPDAGRSVGAIDRPPPEVAGERVIGAAPLVWAHVKASPHHEPPSTNQGLVLGWVADGIDGHPVHGGIVMRADGKPAAMSEVCLRDGAQWRAWLREQIAKADITAIWLPPDISLGKTPADGKLRRYDPDIPADTVAGIPPARRSRTRWAVAGVALAASVALALLVAGERGRQFVETTTTAITSLWEPPPPEVREETWVIRADIEVAEAQCDEALSSPWPVAPEWRLSEEGCAFGVNHREPPGRTPWPRTAPRDFAWRYYTLDGGFEPWLAQRSADRMEELFSGEVHREGETGLVYIMPFALPMLETRPDEHQPVPEGDILRILQATSVGTSRRPPEVSGRGGWTLVSTFGRRELLARIIDLELSPRVIWVDAETGHASVEVVPERLRTVVRQVPVTAGDG